MSLSYLPNELLVHIFKSVKNVSDAAALSRTSRRFHEIFQYNLSSICDTVLPRTIEVYDQAAQLVEARTDPAAISSDDFQTICDAVSNPPDTRHYDTIEEYDQAVQLVKARAKPNIVSSPSSTSEHPVAAVKRAKKLFADADLVNTTLRQFEMIVSLTREAPPELLIQASSLTDPPGISSLEPLTRARFLEAHYRGISVLYLLRKPAAEMCQLFAPLSLLDLFRMCEIMTWLVLEFEMSIDYPDSGFLKKWPALVNERRSLPGITDPYAPLVADEEQYSWRFVQLTDAWGLLLDLVEDLGAITGIEGPEVTYLIRWPDAERFFFLFHGDGSDERAEKAKGVALADVLPLLPTRKYLRRLEVPERH